MVQCNLHNISKRYGTDWVFRNLNFSFSSEKKYALTGHNGSGKSTLLQIISTALSPSKGSKTYLVNDNEVKEENFFTHLSICAPYLELIEEFTLKELLNFHFKFKNPLQNLTPTQIIDICYLQKSANKEIRQYSSGMKQRVKVALAILTQSDFLLLDEPCTNLDQEGIDWYQQLIEQYTNNRLLIVASNRTEEYSFCNEIIKIEDYKK